MSGAASISAAKRRRSGGDVSNMQRGNGNNAPPPPPQQTPKTPQEILAIHDRLLPELIQRSNINTTSVNEMKTLFSKIGENEKNLHNRLQKLEQLFNELADRTNNLGQMQTAPSSNKKEKQEESDRHKRELLQKQEDILEAHNKEKLSNAAMQTDLQSRLQKQMHDNQQQKLMSQKTQQQIQTQFHERENAMKEENARSKIKLQEQQAALEEAQAQIEELRRQSVKVSSEPVNPVDTTPDQTEDTTTEATTPEEDVQKELSSRKNNRNNKKNNKKNNVSLSIGDL